MTLQEKLAQYKTEGRAILAANFYNFETLAGILKAARELEEPIILQLSESSINYLGLEVAAKLARAGLSQFGVEGWLHLDHGASPELALRCLEAGFDSVMIDGSEKPFEENIRISRKVVEIAKSFGANVEAELGFIAKLGQDEDADGFTKPEQARDFVAQTGVNALAVAIGTAHGFYKQEPKLDLERLSQINAITPVPLVLHGGSGIPDEMLRDAIKRGIVKVNLATDSKNAFMKELKNVLSSTEEIDLRKTFPPAIEAVKKLIVNKMRLVSMK
jgi:fructose-bisphosphate aldolase class II/tagatose 1,6-diphosphate aldolase GatY/KbaY